MNRAAGWFSRSIKHLLVLEQAPGPGITRRSAMTKLMAMGTAERSTNEVAASRKK